MVTSAPAEPQQPGELSAAPGPFRAYLGRTPRCPGTGHDSAVGYPVNRDAFR